MRHFVKLAAGVPTNPVLLDLQRNPDLWNAHPVRKTFPGTPHAAMDDIWVRGRAIGELNSPEAYKQPFLSEFYPAWGLLPSLRPLVFSMMAQVQAVHLGGILITRLPPGGSILPHTDLDSWHARHFNTKLHLTLAGRSQSFCGGENVTMLTGDLYVFDNLIIHSVDNDAVEDRVVLIVSMRVEP